MKVRKRVMIGLLVAIIAVPILYYISYAAICPAINDARARKIEKEFSGVALPPQTEIVESYSFCGDTLGKGNHIEIWSGILIKSELQETELIQWAEDVKDSISYTILGFSLWTVPEDLSSQYPQPRDFIQFEHFNGMNEAKGYYIVGSYFYPVTQFDIRGY